MNYEYNVVMIKFSNFIPKRKQDKDSDKSKVVSNFGNKDLKIKYAIYGGLLLVVVIGVIIAWVVTGSNSGFVDYNYNNSGNGKFQIAFYRGSHFGQYSFLSSYSMKAIISPAVAKGGVPWAVGIGGYTGDLSKDPLLSEIKNKCFLSGSSVKTSIYIPSIKVNAVVCSVNGLYDYAYFGNQKSVYYVLIAPYANPFDPYANSKRESKGGPSVVQIKDIVGSFNPLS